MLFRVTGLLACAVAVLEGFVNLWFAGPEHATRPLIALTGGGGDKIHTLFAALLVFRLLGVLAFVSAFWVATRPQGHSTRNGAVLLVAQFVLALINEGDLLYILAAELPFVLPLRAALTWLAVQSAGIAAITAFTMDQMQFNLTATIGPDPVPMDNIPIPLSVVFLVAVGTGVAWQAFAFCMGYIAAAEKKNRIRLAGVNAELVAMQQLLAESARAAERLRIARDLHDGLGHHLAALSLHLDLAARQIAGNAAEAIHTSRDVARKLLLEVRTAVGAERTERPIDLRQALQTLCSGIPDPRIELAFGEPFDVSDPSLAHVIFRSVQEAISNAMRHAHADAIEVALSVHDGGLAVVVSDNGRGVRQIQPGNGLRGMRERVEAHGGTLETLSGAGEGFTVRIWLPRHGRRQ
jgi:signal transduction histidine kinase